MEYVKNKRFLICQPMIGGLCGSTMVTLELGDFLQCSGASVLIYTNYCGEPAKSFFENKQLKIVTFDEADNLRLSDFDYIWVHSQILPISIIKDLGKKHNHFPAFVFLHMSPLNTRVPDEFTWIYDLEKRLASIQLYISDETRQANLKYSNTSKSIPWTFFRNPAPVNFKYRKKAPSKILSNILVVSNHPPQEILEAKKILEKKGLNVVSLGNQQDDYTVITPELLSKFDAVITIGKTVQYCLASGTPVYVYDHFGGPGYLNNSNFKDAKKTNFSGRCCCTKKKPELIAKELITYYNDTLHFQHKNQKKFQDFASIDNVLPKIIKNIIPKKINTFDNSYIQSVIASETFAKIRFQVGEGSYNVIKQLSKDVDWANNEIRVQKEKVQLLEKQLSAKSYKLYSRIIIPYQKIIHFIKRRRNE